MLRTGTFSVLLFLFLAVGCYAQQKASSVSIYKDKNYSKPVIPLRELVKEKSDTKTNTFYLSNIFQPEFGSTYVWVYWKEKDALILWEPRDHEAKYDLVWSRRYLRFGKEIVSREQYVEGTNYMLLTKEGRAIKSECLKGTKLVVERAAN
jgi:hypothetical protein